MIESPRTAVVAGAHRASPHWLVWVWVGFAATQALQVFLSYLDGHGWAVWLHVFGTALGLATAWLWRSQRTVIDPHGLRVKVGWRWRDLPWDEVRSVDAPSRWSPTQVLSVTTTAGQVIATHVPTDLHEDLVVYAAEHRLSRPPNGDRT